MSWIAKNSITGKTYGKSFNSIYDCLNFIDSQLQLLEYEFQRAYALEDRVLTDIKILEETKSGGISGMIMLRIKHAVDSLDGCFSTKKLKQVVTDCFTSKLNSREMDKRLIDLAKTEWLSNNIIRCWYVEQERFADGFDF